MEAAPREEIKLMTQLNIVDIPGTNLQEQVEHIRETKMMRRATAQTISLADVIACNADDLSDVGPITSCVLWQPITSAKPLSAVHKIEALNLSYLAPVISYWRRGFPESPSQ